MQSARAKYTFFLGLGISVGALLLLLGFQAMPHTKCVAGVHGRMYVSEQRSRRGVLDTGRVVLWCKGNAKYEELVQFLSI